mmetsp:Transcript_5425/g.18005  ORF Transcript_5425/g.18005 Transcript_5425/m.18005 type:complete len:232 (+) Transcript_5425:684-1379(+)
MGLCRVAAPDGTAAEAAAAKAATAEGTARRGPAEAGAETGAVERRGGGCCEDETGALLLRGSERLVGCESHQLREALQRNQRAAQRSARCGGDEDAREYLRERAVLDDERRHARAQRFGPERDGSLPHLEQEGLDQHCVARHFPPVGALVGLGADRQGSMPGPVLQEEEEAVAPLAQPVAPVLSGQVPIHLRLGHRLGQPLRHPEHSPRVERFARRRGRRDVHAEARGGQR